MQLEPRSIPNADLHGRHVSPIEGGEWRGTGGSSNSSYFGSYIAPSRTALELCLSSRTLAAPICIAIHTPFVLLNFDISSGVR